MATSKSKQQDHRRSKTSHDAIITTHINADFDALASMIAARKLYPDAALVFPGAQEKNLRNFFLHSTSYLFDFTKIKKIDFDRIKKLILVDTRQKSRIGQFARLVGRKDVEFHIYDHHPDSEDDVHGHMEVIRKIGSTTALLTGIIREKNIAVTADEATIMCLGIHEDTGSFTFSSTTAEDYEAAAWLTLQGADHNVISDMLTRELTAEQVWLLNDLIQAATTRVIRGTPVVITKVIRDEYIGDFAVLVHKFMEMENLNVIFALAQMEDRIYLVARSRIEEVNVGEIALALGGGGHPQAASATIKNKTLIQVERSIQGLLRSRIRPAEKAGEIMTSPVIHISPQARVRDAADLMTRYNINVLLVMEEDGLLHGYVTRQIVEKAVYFSLGDVKVKDYMNIEFPTVPTDASLDQIKSIIVSARARILPVVEDGQVRGVITRTDLLSVLAGEPEPLFDDKRTSRYIRTKNMSAMLKERLPRKILNRLREVGKVADLLGYNAYLVGGLVRDVLLKRENLDVDVVIEGDGIEFAREFVKNHRARMRSHEKFGTAVLIFPDGFKVDVATARMEYYEAPGAPPIVETSSLKMDLYRRDFTINTLAIKLNPKNYGTLIDYFGAQKDIKEKSLRVLHNLSFVEDPTRMLRAVRFEQRFGFRIGKLTLALMKNALKIHSFQDLAGRRFFTELKFILREKDPIRAVERMDELGLLAFISPEIQLSDRTRGLLEEGRRVIAWYNLLYLEEPCESWKVYWHGLFADADSKTLYELADLMGMTDAEGRRLLSQHEAAATLGESLFKFQSDNHNLYTMLAPYDTETLLFTMARATREKIRRLISLYFTRLKQTAIQTTGKDLLAMGLKPGPLFKEIFDRLLGARLNDIVKTKDDELAFVKKHFFPQAEKEPERKTG